jgi:hypothetical protein
MTFETLVEVTAFVCARAPSSPGLSRRMEIETLQEEQLTRSFQSRFQLGLVLAGGGMVVGSSELFVVDGTELFGEELVSGVFEAWYCGCGAAFTAGTGAGVVAGAAGVAAGTACVDGGEAAAAGAGSGVGGGGEAAGTGDAAGAGGATVPEAEVEIGIDTTFSAGTGTGIGVAAADMSTIGGAGVVVGGGAVAGAGAAVVTSPGEVATGTVSNAVASSAGAGADVTRATTSETTATTNRRLPADRSNAEPRFPVLLRNTSPVTIEVPMRVTVHTLLVAVAIAIRTKKI